MNTQKVLLGALLAQPDLAPYSLPDLDVERSEEHTSELQSRE